MGGLSKFRTMREENEKVFLECGVGVVERISTTPPPAVKNNERPAGAEFTIMDGDRLDAGRMRRLRQLQSRHLVLPRQRDKLPGEQGAGLFGWIHGPYITTTGFQDSRSLKMKTADSGSCQP